MTAIAVTIPRTTTPTARRPVIVPAAAYTTIVGGAAMAGVGLLAEGPILTGADPTNLVIALTGFGGMLVGAYQAIRNTKETSRKLEEVLVALAQKDRKIADLIATNADQTARLVAMERQLKDAERQRGHMQTTVNAVADQATLAASTAVSVAKTLAESGPGSAILRLTPDPDAEPTR